MNTNEKWEETLQFEVMEDYLFEAALEDNGDRALHTKNMRGHFERLKSFIHSEIDKAVALREQEIVAGIRALTSVETKNTDIQGEALADIAADTKGEAWELGYEAAIKNVLATITKKD